MCDNCLDVIKPIIPVVAFLWMRTDLWYILLAIYCTKSITNFSESVYLQQHSQGFSSILCLCFQDVCPDLVHVVYLIKPEKFWEKHKTNVGSSKYTFEVCSFALSMTNVKSFWTTTFSAVRCHVMSLLHTAHQPNARLGATSDKLHLTSHNNHLAT